jgi:hypothetical protein
LERVALVVGGAAAANVAVDGEVAEPADCGWSEHLNVDAAPVAFVVPNVPERLYDRASAGQAFSAHDDGWVADDHLRPDHVDVWAELGDADGFGGHDLAYGAANLCAVLVGDSAHPFRLAFRDHS